jgi:hypothetical protein
VDVLSPEFSQPFQVRTSSHRGDNHARSLPLVARLDLRVLGTRPHGA